MIHLILAIRRPPIASSLPAKVWCLRLGRSRDRGNRSPVPLTDTLGNFAMARTSRPLAQSGKSVSPILAKTSGPDGHRTKSGLEPVSRSVPLCDLACIRSACHASKAHTVIYGHEMTNIYC